MKCFFRQHPKIRYHGTQPNAAVREALTRAHVFAYPSVLRPETSCLCLIEAMSAGLVCVHSNLGALFETAWRTGPRYTRSTRDPASTRPCSQNAMRRTLRGILRPAAPGQRLHEQKLYADRGYDWNVRKRQWEGLLRQMLSWPRDFGATA